MTSLEDSQRIAPMGSETGTFVSMVMSYWEQACALLNYGLLHEDLFFRNQRRILWSLGEAQAGRPSISGEVRRQDVLLEPEKAAQRYEKWIEARSPGHIAAMREFTET